MFTVKGTRANSTSTPKQPSFTAPAKHRAGKSTVNRSRRSFRDQASVTEKARRLTLVEPQAPATSNSDSPIVTIAVGHDSRLFACHESVLRSSCYFDSLCRNKSETSTARRITLIDEMPEIFSCILEFLYKGDYYPRLINDKRRQSWVLEDTQDMDQGRKTMVTTIFDPRIQQEILKDTVIYCAADRYGLEDLKRLALRKQGLQSKVQCSIILASARFAYDNTPESDAKLRAHYLALIIRSRQTFKRSGTLQNQMEVGGKMFFDLFVAMCNHMDDISSITKSPR